MIWHYPYQDEPEFAESVVDADWAGNEDDRTSISCVAEFYGKHLIEFNVNGQEAKALSSGESEFYAHCSGGARVLRTRNLLAGFGSAVKGKVRGDSTAAHGICRRKGVGRVRHLEARDLWIQDKVADGSLQIEKVKSEENVADIGTKFLAKEVMEKHVQVMNLEFKDLQA